MSRMPVTETAKRVAALQAKLNKKPEVKGASVMDDIDMAPNTYFLRRPCGIMPLDIDTGGGLPAGGLTYISGPDGTGKTFLLYKYIAMNQRLYGERASCALGVSEAAPDHFFMRKCGVQIAIPERMIEEIVHECKERGLPAYSKEDIKAFRAKTVGNIKLLRGANGEELLGSILDCFDSGLFDIIGLDSISAVLPEADAGKDLDEAAKRAAAAGMVTRFFQHYLNGTTGYYGLNLTTVIFTSQVRSNSKKAEAPSHVQKYLSDYAAQGAWAAKHGKLIDILVKPGQKEKENVRAPVTAFTTLNEVAEHEDKERRQKKIQTGKTVNYEIMKGKAGVHEGITGEFEFNYDVLTEDQRMVIVAGIQCGTVIESDGIVTVYDPGTGAEVPGLEKIQGIGMLVDMMKKDFDLELAMRRAVLTKKRIQCAYR
jgi:RecA/RadA recombinase